MTGIVTVYAVFADLQEACRIGGVVVEEGLAACANILGDCHSIYRWQGKLEVATEVPALFKARADQAQALVARIAELHSYEVPAIVIWPIADAFPQYARWVAGEE